MKIIFWRPLIILIVFANGKIEPKEYSSQHIFNKAGHGYWNAQKNLFGPRNQKMTYPSHLEELPKNYPTLYPERTHGHIQKRKKDTARIPVKDSPPFIVPRFSGSSSFSHFESKFLKSEINIPGRSPTTSQILPESGTNNLWQSRAPDTYQNSWLYFPLSSLQNNLWKNQWNNPHTLTKPLSHFWRLEQESTRYKRKLPRSRTNLWPNQSTGIKCFPTYDLHLAKNQGNNPQTKFWKIVQEDPKYKWKIVRFPVKYWIIFPSSNLAGNLCLCPSKSIGHKYWWQNPSAKMDKYIWNKASNYQGYFWKLIQGTRPRWQLYKFPFKQWSKLPSGNLWTNQMSCNVWCVTKVGINLWQSPPNGLSQNNLWQSFIAWKYKNSLWKYLWQYLLSSNMPNNRCQHSPPGTNLNDLWQRPKASLCPNDTWSELNKTLATESTSNEIPTITEKIPSTCYNELKNIEEECTDEKSKNFGESPNSNEELTKTKIVTLTTQRSPEKTNESKVNSTTIDESIPVPQFEQLSLPETLTTPVMPPNKYERPNYTSQTNVSAALTSPPKLYEKPKHNTKSNISTSLTNTATPKKKYERPNYVRTSHVPEALPITEIPKKKYERPKYVGTSDVPEALPINEMPKKKYERPKYVGTSNIPEVLMSTVIPKKKYERPKYFAKPSVPAFLTSTAMPKKKYERPKYFAGPSVPAS